MNPRRSAAAVWLVWAVALASILIAIARDGRNIPFEEDWLMVGPMLGQEPDVPRWLWSQNSEHRLPLPRLVNLVLLRASGDFRSTMVFNVLALALVAAAMIVTARSLRGGVTSPADAFFPLLLLHLGNWDNLVWGWQIQFVLPTALACVLLLIVVTDPEQHTRGVSIAGALALICLPLSGANGLVLTPALAAWFAYTAWARRRRDQSDHLTGSWIPGGAALVAIVLCVIYFVGYESSPWNEPSPGLRAAVETTLKFVALAVGPAAASSWLLFGGLMLLILLGCLFVLFAARQRWSNQLRLAGFLAFFASFAVLAVAVGWGRAGRAAATGRMPTRYVLLAAPVLCAAYFTLLLYGRERLQRTGPAALAVLMAVLLPFNTHVGLQRREWFGTGMVAFERDLASGALPTVLARRHHGFLLHWDEPLMVSSMRMLRDSGIGPFTRIPREPDQHAPVSGE
ncbi:MAG TPA: hypothetical protein VFH26_05425 [Gemmatimonadales bacterium]|nr:hypothetical protein [Gemmatimonadales bacterium]